MKINTVIVDDEALSRRGIELRLRDAGDFNIVAQCTNGREALAAISTYKPDLVFLDIQMPGMSGFEVVAHLPQESLPVLVFVTAYDQYAVQAFEARAVDYLLKPIDEGRFKAALERVREHVRAKTAANQRDRLMEIIAEITGSGELALDELLARGRAAVEARHPEVLPIRQGRETVRVPVASIRSTIVNLRLVKSLRAHMNGEYFLTLDGGHELKLSRTYRDKVEYFLNTSGVS
jgi:two-component system, LytTR family, response regulator